MFSNDAGGMSMGRKEMPVPVGAILGNSGSGIGGCCVLLGPPTFANQVRHGCLVAVLVFVPAFVLVVAVVRAEAVVAVRVALFLVSWVLLMVALPGELARLFEYGVCDRVVEALTLTLAY